jgi:hypothetical protein
VITTTPKKRVQNDEAADATPLSRMRGRTEM